ncbi:uncharacterized protein [Spinacia oleracea]|uniref:Reverse transcriptase domain-containing protein n=1 Tax=Spinacia oleracea TaxID=3562 RepID=A0ABM3QZJ3_SPIOL|nr:uncharacterized protein LOC110798179 [Spinacia oleracea]
MVLFRLLGTSQRPSIFILLETRSDDYRAQEVMIQLKFNQFKVISPTDKRGGIWLFWKNTIDLILFSEDVNQFHVLFHFENVRPEVLITGLHAPSVPGPRHALWRNMADNLPPSDTPWLMVGDMNEVTSQSEKMGGRPFRSGQCKDLRNFMDAAGLVDLGFHGNPYTWTNARDGAGLIKERLDRALANSPWLDIFPHTQIAKKRLLARINGIQLALSKSYSQFLVNLERDLINQLNTIFRRERIIWAQKAGLNWWKFGDYNTKYFHIIAKVRKSRGKILTLKNSDGVWVTDVEVLKDLAVSYFDNLFQTSLIKSTLGVFCPNVNMLTNEDRLGLLNPISKDEVWHNLRLMDPIKSPGPDGIQPIFFQRYWAELGDSIFKFCASCFLNAAIPSDINRSFITLIPKVDAPKTMRDFRPIGLCNTIYKLITKIITTRVRPILGKIISPFQSSFVQGRGIEDNIILVKEMAHVFHKSRKGNNIMALKLDLTKAYDSLEWSFIRDTLVSFGFPSHLISLIMSCITTPHINVLWNGALTREFCPSRGIRQGDPLSSYIFVLCLDRLSMLIQKEVDLGHWKPITLSRTVKISHVFYADDVFLFGHATPQNMESMLDVLKGFGEISGLRINMQKSSLIFPTHMSHVVRNSIANPHGLTVTSSLGKYLGVDIRPNKLKIANFVGLLDKTMDRIKGWQAKLLNMAGRCTLLKSVLNTYPLYNMQTSLLPARVINSLEKSSRKFLWNKVDRSRFMVRTSWANVTKPLSMGGLGVRRLKEWNLAFMAKLGWSAKFLDCFSGSHQSPMWRDILKGRSLLQKGLIVGIGNGRSTSLWYHHWVGSGPLYKLIDRDIPERIAHFLVSDIIRDGQWDFTKVSQFMPPDICDMIRLVPLATCTNVEDFIRWVYTKNGVFSVKSAYFLLLHNHDSPTQLLQPFNWKSIWKIKVPFKYKMLLWNACHEIFPVAEMLHLRLDYISPRCSRCDLVAENHIHLFRDCGDSSILWNFIFTRLLPNHKIQLHSFFSLSWREWLWFNLNQGSAWSIIFCVALWHIWKARNRAVFYHKMFKSFSVYNAFYVDLVDTNKALQGKGKAQVSKRDLIWKPLAYEFLKLNTDGSWKAKNEAGGGGVFRGATGKWYMGYASKFNAITPLAAELYAVREGLIMAADYGIQNLELETDAQLLVNMLESASDSYHDELRPVLVDVAGLMAKFSVVVVKHIPKAKNKVAHALACYAIEMAVGHKLFLTPPPFAAIAYEGDLQKLEDAEKLHLLNATSSSRPIDLEASPEEDEGELVSTSIMFGTIPATIITTVPVRGGNVNVEHKEMQLGEGAPGAGDS